MVLGKLRQVVVDIEDDGYGDNQCDTEKVIAHEFLDDVPVQSLDVSQWVEEPEKPQEPKFVG